MPFRRYQTPSRVRQTSSASILLPLVKTITCLPPGFWPMPGPLVEIGAAVVREWDVAMRSGVCFGMAEGAGEGDAVSLGAGETIMCCGRGACSGVRLATETGSMVL